MNKNIKIRAADTSDSDTLIVLCITVWVDTYCFEGIEAPHASYVLTKHTSKNIKQTINERTVFVAELNDLAIGLVVFNEESGEIETLYVLPRFKGLGAGKALIQNLKALSPSRLFLECWEGNNAAQYFYKKLGFIESGENFLEIDGKTIRNITFISE